MAISIVPENDPSARNLRIEELKVERSKIEAEMSKVQGLEKIAKLRERIVSIDLEIKRLR